MKAKIVIYVKLIHLNSYRSIYFLRLFKQIVEEEEANRKKREKMIFNTIMPTENGFSDGLSYLKKLEERNSSMSK